MSSYCEDESISTPDECRITRKPVRPNADGSCPPGHEKMEGFLVPTCLPPPPANYQCLPSDPRLCLRPRPTHPPLSSAYPMPLS